MDPEILCGSTYHEEDQQFEYREVFAGVDKVHGGLLIWCHVLLCWLDGTQGFFHTNRAFAQLDDQLRGQAPGFDTT